MNIAEIVMKLTGPIEPVGESIDDAQRLENLDTLTKAVDALIREIGYAAMNNTRHEASMRRIGNRATTWLAGTSCELLDYCDAEKET